MILFYQNAQCIMLKFHETLIILYIYIYIFFKITSFCNFVSHRVCYFLRWIYAAAINFQEAK